MPGVVGARFQDPPTEAVGALDDRPALVGVALHMCVRACRVVREEEDVRTHFLPPSAAADPLPERDFRLAAAGELHQADGRHVNVDVQDDRAEQDVDLTGSQPRELALVGLLVVVTLEEGDAQAGLPYKLGQDVAVRGVT
jgi:hypothetical protein